MRITSNDKLQDSTLLQSSPCIFVGARLIPNNEDDYLEIYDSELGPEGKVLAYLDKDTPSIMFQDGLPCTYGIYAFLPREGEYIVYTG
jgi:hypothetical protein